jgi:hypothetical protein
MKPTAEELCHQIETNRLTSPEDAAALRARWFQPGRKEAHDGARFGEWLRANHYVTDFVLSALHHGRSDRLTLDQYRLTDLLRSGSGAGDFLAVDPLDRAVRVAVLAPAASGAG